MKLSDWIFGKKVDWEFPHAANIRPLTLEPDNVREAFDILARHGLNPELIRIHDHDEVGGYQEIPTPINSFTDLPDWQIAQLVIRGDNAAVVKMRATQQPTISYDPQAKDAATTRQAIHEVAEAFLNEGRPRLRRYELMRWLPAAVGCAAIAATWLWVVLDARPPRSVVAAGTLVALLLCIGYTEWLRTHRTQRHWRSTGHRIRSRSRNDGRRERQDQHRDWWVFIKTAPIAAALGWLANNLLTRG